MLAKINDVGFTCGTDEEKPSGKIEQGRKVVVVIFSLYRGFHVIIFYEDIPFRKPYIFP